MRIEITQQIIELGDEIENADGTIEFIPNGETTVIEIIDIYADEGKLFRNKLTGIAISRHITIGSNDSADNYEEVTT